MKSILFTMLFASLLIGIFSTLTKAQETNLKNSNTALNFCEKYRYENPADLRRAKFRGSEGQGAITRYLQEFLKQCANSNFRRQAEEDFKIITEESGDDRLSVAKYYLKLYEEKNSGLNGAHSRLRELSEKYPNYSKLDEVLFLLVKVNLIKGNSAEAEQNYRKLFDKFYLSEYVCQANSLLRQAKQSN